jgi:hypothetical protein
MLFNKNEKVYSKGVIYFPIGYFFAFMHSSVPYVHLFQIQIYFLKFIILHKNRNYFLFYFIKY